MSRIAFTETFVDLLARPSFTDLVEDEDQLEDEDGNEEQKTQGEVSAGINNQSVEQSSYSIQRQAQMAPMQMPEAENMARRLTLTMGGTVEAVIQCNLVTEVAYLPVIMIGKHVEYWMIGVAMASYDFGFMMVGLLKIKIDLKIQTLTLSAVGVLLMLIDRNILEAILVEWGVFLLITIVRILQGLLSGVNYKIRKQTRDAAHIGGIKWLKFKVFFIAINVLIYSIYGESVLTIRFDISVFIVSGAFSILIALLNHFLLSRQPLLPPAVEQSMLPSTIFLKNRRSLSALFLSLVTSLALSYWDPSYPIYLTQIYRQLPTLLLSLLLLHIFSLPPLMTLIVSPLTCKLIAASHFDRRYLMCMGALITSIGLILMSPSALIEDLPLNLTIVGYSLLSVSHAVIQTLTVPEMLRGVHQKTGININDPQLLKSAQTVLTIGSLCVTILAQISSGLVRQGGIQFGTQVLAMAGVGFLAFLAFFCIAVICPRDRSWDEPEDYSLRYTINQSDKDGRQSIQMLVGTDINDQRRPVSLYRSNLSHEKLINEVPEMVFVNRPEEAVQVPLKKRVKMKSVRLDGNDMNF